MFDEAHEYLGGHRDRARQHMTQLAAASGWPMQRIFMTASLPPYLEKKLLRLSHLDPRHTLVIRGRTVRPELAHHLLIVPPSKRRGAQEVLIDLVRALRGTLKPRERMIVFVPSIPDAERLSRILNAAIHHSLLPEVANTQAMNIDMWITGEKLCIVATPGLIQGFHYPHTRYVFFLQFVYGMMNYFQGSGRGGRSGERADVFLVRDPVVPFTMDRFATKPKCQTDVTALHDMYHYATKHTTCRQFLISQCMDGEGMNCEDFDEAELCDVCDPHGVMTQIGQSALLGPPIIPASLLEPSGAIDGPATEVPEVTLVPETPSEADMVVAEQPETLSTRRDAVPEKAVPRKRSIAALSSEDEFGYDSIDLDAFDLLEKQAMQIPQPPPGSGTAKRMCTDNIRNPSSSTRALSRSSSSGNATLGLSILRQVEEVSRAKTVRLATTNILNEILGVIGGKCPICWVLKGVCVEKHAPFHGCVASGTITPVPWTSGWIAFKRQIKFPFDFTYCWNCGLPMERRFNGEEPERHRQWSVTNRGGGSSPLSRTPVVCPFADLVVLVAWVVFHDSNLRSLASTHFGFAPDIALDDFVIWIQVEEAERGQYWKGVEILAWCYARWTGEEGRR